MHVVTTRVLEATVGACGFLGVGLAQTTTLPGTTLVEQVAKLSPTALMAICMYVLWNRYTTREDAATVREQRVMDLTERTVTVMQEVRDALKDSK